MEENDDDDATLYWKEIEHRALPILIECANRTYFLNLNPNDLDLEFSIKYALSRSLGNGEIRFGMPHARALEYSMFDGDPDLEIPPHLSINRQFQAWWVAAHELAHEIVDMIQRKTNSISQPIIPNALIKFDLDMKDHGTDVLVDLLENQAWWKESHMRGHYHLSYDDKAFKHGVFYQHIYRTLRRDVVNPKFGIVVGDWKQKSKPKIRYVKSGWRGGNKRRSIRITGPILI